MDSKEILDARRTISGSVNETPLVYSKFFSEACGGRVDLKLVTSSFKGALETQRTNPPKWTKLGFPEDRKTSSKWQRKLWLISYI